MDLSLSSAVTRNTRIGQPGSASCDLCAPECGLSDSETPKTAMDRCLPPPHQTPAVRYPCWRSTLLKITVPSISNAESGKKCPRFRAHQVTIPVEGRRRKSTYVGIIFPAISPSFSLLCLVWSFARDSPSYQRSFYTSLSAASCERGFALSPGSISQSLRCGGALNHNPVTDTAVSGTPDTDSMLGILARSRSFRVGGAGASGGGAHAGDSGKAHGPTAPVTAEPGFVSGPTLQKSSVLGLVDNAGGPSRAFPEGGKSYVNRPLPPPPPRTPSTMLLRPGTSSGSSVPGKGLGKPTFDKRMSRDDMFLTSTSKRPAFDKRMSRDDMYVGTKAARDFHAPIRGQLPTPEASPPYNAPTFAAVPARMATPESLSGEIQIGMALGSPGHPAPPAIPAAWEQFAPKVDASPETEAVGEPVLQRTKTTRRKLFAFFGGGKKHQDTPRVTIESSETGSTLMTSALSVSRSSSNATTGKKAPKYQPIIVPTNSEPSALSPIPVVPETRTPRFLRAKASEPVMRKPSVKGFSSQDTLRPPPAVSPIARSASPFLDIEIPDIKMERYSVMFGSVLNPQQPPSSLLARRQATLDRLKTINDKLREEDAKEAARQKRKTSPQPVKSPAFSLFPQSTPSAKKPESPRKLSPRMRSNTSPAVLPSPVQPTFEHDPMRAERGKGNFLKVNPLRVNPTKTKRVEPPVREQLEPAQPKVVQFDPTRSNLFLDSPTDDAEFEDNTGRLAEPFRPNIPEPQWQMISPPSSAAPSTALVDHQQLAQALATLVGLVGADAPHQAVRRRHRRGRRQHQVGGRDLYRPPDQHLPAAEAAAAPAEDQHRHRSLQRKR